MPFAGRSFHGRYAQRRRRWRQLSDPSALVFTGVPPVIANATGTVALLPGYIAGAWGFKDDMQSPPGLSMKQVVALS